MENQEQNQEPDKMFDEVITRFKNTYASLPENHREPMLISFLIMLLSSLGLSESQKIGIIEQSKILSCSPEFHTKMKELFQEEEKRNIVERLLGNLKRENNGEGKTA